MASAKAKADLTRELMYLVHQFLTEEKYHEAALWLEQESGFFFNVGHLEPLLMSGNWDAAERYLSGFTGIGDNPSSTKIFFEIRKQKYYEALEEGDKAKAISILENELKVFEPYGKEGLYKELLLLLSLDNIRDKKELSEYGDTETRRKGLAAAVDKLARGNPALQDKIVFPSINDSRLLQLIAQSFQWQHLRCKKRRPDPEFESILFDHSCSETESARMPSTFSSFESFREPASTPVQSDAHDPKDIGEWLAKPVAAVGAAKADSVQPTAQNPDDLPERQVQRMAKHGISTPEGAVARPNSEVVARGVHYSATPALTTPRIPDSAPQAAVSQETVPRAEMAKPPKAPCFSVSKTQNWASNLTYGLASVPHLTSRAAAKIDNPSLKPNCIISKFPVTAPSKEASFKHPRTFPTNSALTHKLADTENEPKMPRHAETSNEKLNLSKELPKCVARTLNQGSYVRSMDFHPSQPSLLLVGTNVADVAVWEVALGKRLLLDNFEVWNLPACSVSFQESLIIDSAVAVNRVAWNPDGTQFGVAYSRHIVHLYIYNGHPDLKRKLEIEAHVGEVHDLAFLQPSNRLCLVTCGDDKTVKVWDAITGEIQYTWDGHEAPVLSICQYDLKTSQVIYAASMDGNIKLIVHNRRLPKVIYHSSGCQFTNILCTPDGKRLFFCEIDEEGKPHIVRWKWKEWTSEENCHPISCKGSTGVVHFDVSNQFLAAGDSFMVKFWDVNTLNSLGNICDDAEGGFPASPHIRFNKDGSMLAVSTNNNCIKILANADGLKLLESRSASKFMAVALTIEPKGTVCGLARTSVAVVDLAVPGTAKSETVSRLLYMNSGEAILALASNGLHKVWKRQSSDREKRMKAATCVPPQLWQYSSNILMTNEQSDETMQEPIQCFALTKNEAYLASASGGSISLYVMKTFKRMATFSPTPSAATCLAFYPEDNNIIAIGTEDSSICIYNAQLDQVISTLRSHQKRITGLAFSNVLEILVSLGADNKLCIWDTDKWKMQGSKFIQTPSEGPSSPFHGTQLQFHIDQIHFLVVQENCIAVYEATKLGCLNEITNTIDASIIHATYSCDSKLVFACFVGGNMAIFDATMKFHAPRCWIEPTAYLPPQSSSSVFPVFIAAHPSEPNQFAVGLSDGGVIILNP